MNGRLAGERNGTRAGLMLAVAVGVLALPSAVLAFATKFEVGHLPGGGAQTSLSPLRAGGDGPRLARALSLQWLGRDEVYPFTPAKNPNRPDRSVTVAVRVDSQALRTITVMGTRADPDAGSNGLRLAQTAFNLGVSRGYRNFGQDVAPPAARKNDLPELPRYNLSPGVKKDEPRFAPRILLDDRAAAGRAPRTFAGDKDDRVDLGGAYRVTRNLDVTAGVRYSQDRERLLPLTDGNRDNQAVYVGTQFHF